MPCNDWNIWCGSCWNAYRSCGCLTVSEIKLPGPVASVSSVVIDGVELDQTDYRIDDYQWLVRLDGGTWPANTDYTDPDAFSVTYALGVEPPAGAGRVTGILMCARSGCSNGGCSIPKRATQVTRQGVTMILGNADGTVFGLPDVDQWVYFANQPTRAGAVHSPDLPKVRQITWEATSP